MRTRALYALSWLVAVVVATTIGLVAVTLVGEAVRGSGPIGDDFTRDQAGAARQPAAAPDPDPQAEVVRREFRRNFGTFAVTCQGVLARSEPPRARREAGWHLVRYEPGPDDDVEAVFATRDDLIELEVFCNGGRPQLAELETNRVDSD